jgi:alpha-tubulin suppressor-like RCC1 family protein
MYPLQSPHLPEEPTGNKYNLGVATAVAIKADGTLWTWGGGTLGLLGNAVTTGNISTPVTTFAGGTNWKQVSSGNLHVAALTYDDPVI